MENEEEPTANPGPASVDGDGELEWVDPSSFVDYALWARLLVAQYYNSKVEKTDNLMLTTDEVYIVWFCKTLQNWKALLSTTIPDGMYYEVTHNGNGQETYLDVYKKWDNIAVPNTPIEDLRKANVDD